MGVTCSTLFGSRPEVVSNSRQNVLHISKMGLHANEVSHIVRTFKTDKSITRTDLIDTWWNYLTPKFLNLMENYLLFESDHKLGIDKSISVIALGFLLRDLTRGSDEELANFFMTLYERGNEIDGIYVSDLKQFQRDLVMSIVRLLKFRNNSPYLLWTEYGCTLDLESLKRWVEHSMTCLQQYGDMDALHHDDVKDYISFNRLSLQLMAYLVRGLFSLDVHKSTDTEELLPIYPPLPELDLGCLAGQDDFPFLLDLAGVMFINSQIPPKNRIKWKLLYSFDTHGRSFSLFYPSIQSATTTLLVLKGKDSDNVFGGYASNKWKLGPNFIGDEQCFLFQLSPKMNVFRTSGYNKNYMYLNNNQKTLPNGLGMGGQFEYWGLWIDSGLEQGSCSETCTTFSGYTMLSATQVFELDKMEIWGLDDKYYFADDEEEDEGGSILTKDPTARAMLDMLGKTGDGRNFLEKRSNKYKKF